MKKIITYYTKLPIVWHIIFFTIAIINLAAPLLFHEVNDRMAMVKDIQSGFNEIKTDFEVLDGKLVAESEMVRLDDGKTVISVLFDQDYLKDSNYISFQRDFVEINIDNHISKIDYDKEMQKEELAVSVQKQLASAAVIAILANAFVSILMSVIVFLVMMMVAHYILRKSVKFRVLFRLLTLPFLLGAYISVLAIFITSHYMLVYLLAMLVIGFMYTILLKNKLKESSTDFYFGKGDNVNELY